MSIIAYIANIFRGELGRGKRNSSFFNLRSSLSFILSIALLFGVSSAWAADWTDADGKTYTALKSINGGGNGTAAGGFIITDITPAGTEIVKFKVKTPAAVTKNGCVYCARSFTKSGNKWTVDATQFAGFRLAKKFRIDRKGTQTSLDDETCTPATEYSVSANYSTGAVTVNNLVQSQNLSTDTGSSYTPGGKLAILASYSDIAAPASPTAGSSWYNCSPDDLYYLQLWNADGETLEHDFRPARRDSDGAIGLYDTVVGKFWTATKGSFTGVELSSVATATWTGAANNGDFSDPGNWTCYDGDGNAVADVIPESTTDITLGADVPDAGWTAFNASYAGTINLNGHRLVICGGSELKFSVTDDSSSEVPGELRFTIPENETFEKTAGLRISGNLSLVKDGPGTFLWSHDAASALAATIPVLVTNGVFKIGATTGNLFGAGGTVTVKAPGQFDINTAQQYGPVRARTFYIEGDGPDGSGAIVNSAANTIAGRHLNKIVLTGDATIGGMGNIDIRDSGNGVDCGGYELTVKNTGRLCVEAGTHLNNATDIVVDGGRLQVCNSCVLGAERIVLENGGIFDSYMTSGTKEYNVPFVVSEGSGTIKTISNYFHIYSTITVESGCTLDLPSNAPWYDTFDVKANATLNISGGTCMKVGAGGLITNDGTINHTAGRFCLGYRDGIGACSVTNNGLIKTTGGTFEFKAESSMAGTGTLELAGGSPQVLGDLSGFTGTVVVSNGVAVTFAGVNCGGTVAVQAGATLNIANYTAGVTSFTAQSLILPEDEGIVSLTLNGGAFGKGIYAICAAPGVTAADGDKFTFTTTDELIGKWSVDDDTLILTVGEIPSNYWTGRGGDGKMSTGANWGDGKVPAAGSNIDLSGITAATTIIADANRTFGAVTMGAGVITFTNAMAATSFVSEATHNPTAKIAVAADSTVTIVGDLVFATNSACYVCYSIAEGGMFAVTGDIIATDKQKSYVIPCQTASNAGVISAKGLVNNINKSDDYFALARDSNNALAKWVIGEDGLSGTKRFFVVRSSGATVMITAATNFTISAAVVQFRNLTLDPAGYEITLGTNTSAKSGGILGGGANGLTSVIGTGKVIVNYNVNDLSTSATSRTNAFIVATGATLAFAPGGNIGFGLLTVQDGGTLEVAESGTVTHNGNLSLEKGAALAFNFTDRKTAPVLALAEEKAVTFTGEGEIAVKITGDVWPIGGDYVLTACGGFNAEGVTVSLADGAPKWAKDIRVNAEGNIVLTVRPKPTMIIVR